MNADSLLPPTACIPVCTTFMALGIFAFLIWIWLPIRSDDNTFEEVKSLRQLPAWWKFALIPVCTAAILGLLYWATIGN